MEVNNWAGKSEGLPYSLFSKIGFGSILVNAYRENTLNMFFCYLSRRWNKPNYYIILLILLSKAQINGTVRFFELSFINVNFQLLFINRNKNSPTTMYL